MTCSVKNLEPTVMWGWVGPQPKRQREIRKKRVRRMVGNVSQKERRRKDNAETQRTQRHTEKL
jgi:hypothetical protein